MLVVGSNVCEFPGPSLYGYVISTSKVKFGGSGGTCLVETACTCRRCVRELYLFGEVIFLHGCRYCMRDRVRDSMLWYSNKLSAHGIFKTIWLCATQKAWGLTSGTSFSLRRSLGANFITSTFNLCSAASPVTGFDSTVGLSFADTHGATP